LIFCTLVDHIIFYIKNLYPDFETLSAIFDIFFQKSGFMELELHLSTSLILILITRMAQKRLNSRNNTIYSTIHPTLPVFISSHVFFHGLNLTINLIK
jgi:hypothetical protein